MRYQAAPRPDKAIEAYTIPLLASRRSRGGPRRLRQCASSPGQSQSFDLRSLIGGIYLPALFFGIGQWMIIPAIPQFADELGASVFLSGLIFAARGARLDDRRTSLPAS